MCNVHFCLDLVSCYVESVTLFTNRVKHFYTLNLIMYLFGPRRRPLPRGRARRLAQFYNSKVPVGSGYAHDGTGAQGSLRGELLNVTE